MLQTGIISRYDNGENTIVEKLNQGMHQIGYQDWQILSLVLLVKVDWIQDVLHSLTTAFHQQFTLPPVSLGCDVTAIAENPAQINGGNIKTEKTEAKFNVNFEEINQLRQD